MGDKVHNFTEWGPITEERFSTAFGQPVTMERQVKSDVKVPPNPFKDHADCTKHLLLVTQEDTELVFKEVNTQSGFIYASSFELHTKWEVYAPFPGSKKTVLGHSRLVFGPSQFVFGPSLLVFCRS